MAFNLVNETKNNIECVNILIKKASIPAGQSKKLTDEERNVLKSYKGFGGIKEILYPHDNDSLWKNKSPDLKTSIQEFKDRLFDYCQLTNRSYDKYLRAIQNSTQTAFYTPQVITDSIALNLSSLQDLNASGNILEPSCGHGSFLSALINNYLPITQNVNILGLEKDDLTGDISKILNQGVIALPNKVIKTTVYPTAFEKANLQKNTYSLVVSNIPFGDVQVFDKSYFENAKNRTPEERDILDFAQKSLHNYFAVKSLDVAEDNGIVAIITTGSFANSSSNRIIREYLLQQSELISAVRFPDTLFKEEANTEAPSDLLIFRKFKNGVRPIEKPLTNKESQFINNSLHNNINWNDYFYFNRSNVIHSDIIPGTNQYGNPNYEVKFKGQTEDIAKQINKILYNDFSRIRQEHAQQERANREAISIPQLKPVFNNIEPETIKATSTILDKENNRPDANELYERYFNKLKKKSVKKSPKKVAEKIKNSTVDLFSQPQIESFDLFYQSNKSPQKEVVNVPVNHISPKAEISNSQPIDLFSTSTPGLEKAEPIQKKETPDIKKNENTTLTSFHYSSEELYGIPSFKDGMLYFDETDQFYQLFRNDLSGLLEEKKIDIKKLAVEENNINENTFDINRLKGILNIRNAYNILFDTEHQTQTEQADLRENLNAYYDQFVNRYSILNKPLNKRYAGIDEDFTFTITGVEVPVPDLDEAKIDFVKSSIFNRPVNILNKEYIIKDEKSALIYSINTFGIVDLEVMSEKSGIDKTQLEDKLSDYILFNPETKKHELKSIYLNENLYKRLDSFKEAVKTNLTPLEQLEYKTQLIQTERAIRDNIPPIIPFEDIDVVLGERWIPSSVFSSFATDLFSIKTDISYFNSTDEFKAAALGHSYEMRTYYTAQTLAGNKTAVNLLESALLDETLVVTYTDKDKNKFTDNEGTVVCNEIIQRIRGKFIEWLDKPENQELRKELTDLYNYKFNGISIQKFDGSLLNLDDVNWANLGLPEGAAYDSQKDSVMMLLCNQGGIVDHVPGGGKTLIECMTAHYMKKLGLAKKPIIIGMRANLKDLVATYKQAFPQDKIIAPSTDDFSAKNRVKLFNQIKNNDWDCVFLTHNQFEKIPADPEIQQEFIQEEIRDVQLNLDAVMQDTGEMSRRALKGLEKKKANLEAKLESTIERINSKKDNFTHFGQLGIDHIIVDESHVFKNLEYSTRHTQIGGLGNPKGSERAFNLKCALSTLQERTGKDLQASFFSGTPISNSLTEMYLLFKYLTPIDLKSKNIINFDSWAAIFARKSSELELSLTNQLVVKERFREFTKVPELAKDYRRITDYRSAEDIGLKRPIINEKLVVATPTDKQMEIFLDMQDFMQSGNSSLFDFESDADNLRKAKALIAANICAKTCLDIRFVKPEEEFQLGSKAHLLIETVGEYYFHPDYSKDKATQLIFLDSGVPGGSTFNLYQDIKDNLINKGIKPDEIAFIHDYDKDHMKPILNQKMKDGAIRVLIGGTEKLGTGWNIQSRIIAMHNFDIPWKPSEFDQRKGRGQRAGNWLAEKHGGVNNLFYVTENSPEVAKVDRVKIKAGFINQIKNGSISVRKIDEGTLDEGSGLSYADIVMQTSGDTRYKEQNRLENLISKMEVEKASFIKIAANNKHKLEDLTKSIPNHEQNIKTLKLDLADYTPRIKYIDSGEHKGELLNETKINGQAFSTEEQLGRYLLNISQKNMSVAKLEIGSLYDFKIIMNENYIYDESGKNACNTFQIQNHGRPITYNSGIISMDSSKRAARHFYYALNRIEAIIEREENSLNKAQKELSKIKESPDIEYPKIKELETLKKELATLTEDIKRDMNNKKNDNGPEQNPPLAQESKENYLELKRKVPRISF